MVLRRRGDLVGLAPCKHAQRSRRGPANALVNGGQRGNRACDGGGDGVFAVELLVGLGAAERLLEQAQQAAQRDDEGLLAPLVDRALDAVHERGHGLQVGDAVAAAGRGDGSW